MRARPPLRFVLAITVLAAFTIWITWRAKALEMKTSIEGTASRMMSKPAPDFTLDSWQGPAISLAGYRGKTVVASFWASWCGPCRMEMPVLTKFYQQMHRADSDFEFLAISIDTSKGDAEGAARGMKIPFPVLFDPESRTAGSYQVDAIPTLFVIDKSGKVIFAHTGFTMGLDFLLAQELQIKNYLPGGGKP